MSSRVLGHFTSAAIRAQITEWQKGRSRFPPLATTASQQAIGNSLSACNALRRNEQQIVIPNREYRKNTHSSGALCAQLGDEISFIGTERRKNNS